MFFGACLLSQIVEFDRHRGLFTGRVVLRQQTLAGCAVNGLNGNFIGIDGCIAVAFGNGRVKLFIMVLSSVLSARFLARSSFDFSSRLAEDLMLAMFERTSSYKIARA